MKYRRAGRDGPPASAISMGRGSQPIKFGDPLGNGVMLDFGIEKLFRDAATAQHTDGGIDITCFRIVKGMFPETAGIYAGPEK